MATNHQISKPANKLAKIGSQRGFTLIELVVVIVILGILAATTLPKFVNLGEDARKAAVNNLAGAVRTTLAMVNPNAPSQPQHAALMPRITAAQVL